MTDVAMRGGSEWTALSRWRIRNFKSIGEADLQFGPLTLLVGPNSSGKSTVIQSILLLVQAAQGESEGSTFPLNGPLVALGGYDDVRFKLAKKASVSVGGTFRFDERRVPGLGGRSFEYWRPMRHFRRTAPVGIRGLVDLSLSFDRGSIDEPGSADISDIRLRVDIPDDAPTSVEVEAIRRGQGEIEEDLERIRVGKLAWPTREDFSLGFTGRVQAMAEELDLQGLALRAGIPHGIVTTWQLGALAALVWVESRTQRPVWRGDLGPGIRDASEGEEPTPEELVVLGEWAQKAAADIGAWDQLRVEDQTLGLPAFLSKERPVLPPNDRVLITSHAHTLIDDVVELLSLDEPVYAPPEALVGGSLVEPSSELHRFLSERVVYLGPLREDPQVTYRSTPAGATGYIGTKGEYMASVLHAGRSREVACPLEDGSLERMRLADALDYWVRRLDLADSVSTRDLGRLGLQLAVSRGGITDLDLTSVGVGVSQLLPVVVMCLLSPPGSLIILEQPELHLHPALQQRLGDFFIACSQTGRQLLVETHSEYLVSRLRRRVAEDERGGLLRQVAVIFAEQTDGESALRRVELNELGGIDHWPTGFFDQTAEESKAILQAGLGKKLRRVRTGDRTGE